MQSAAVHIRDIMPAAGVSDPELQEETHLDPGAKQEASIIWRPKS